MAVFSGLCCRKKYCRLVKIHPEGIQITSSDFQTWFSALFCLFGVRYNRVVENEAETDFAIFLVNYTPVMLVC